MFKKFINEREGKESRNLVDLYLDIDSYQKLGQDRTQRPRKDIQSAMISK